MSTSTTDTTVARAEPGRLTELLRPGDAGYDDARRVWNGAIDRRPAMIARCHSTDEVATAVRIAIASGLEIAVRGGGHSIPGLSVCEGGMMIDLSPMKGLRVDVPRRVASAQPGLTWREYDAGTHAHGLASPGGEISDTGVAGLTLGGGIGWLSRRHGLACDNLIGVEMVTADGSVIDIDDERDPELMWGLRGGGGNFGIVTEFRFRVHPIEPLPAGLMIWPTDRRVDALQTYVGVAANAPRDLALTGALLCAPPAPFVPPSMQFTPVTAVAVMWTGDPAEADDAFERLRDANPAVDTVALTPYPEIQQWFDEGTPPGRRYHVRSEWLDELDHRAAAELVEAADRFSSPFNQLLVRRLGGAIADVSPDATAFRFRDATYMLTVAAGWDDGPAEPHRAWTRSTWERMRPWSSGGSYVNHLADDEGSDRVREAYGAATWSRLVDLKRRLDPSNVFHLNQNIDPRYTSDQSTRVTRSVDGMRP